MRSRRLLWNAAQLTLAAVFLLMGIYGGDVPLGLFIASLLCGTVARPTSPGRLRERAAVALRSAGHTLARLAPGSRAYGYAGWALAAVAIALAATGRLGAALSTVISLYVGWWLVWVISARAMQLVRPDSITR